MVEFNPSVSGYGANQPNLPEKISDSQKQDLKNLADTMEKRLTRQGLFGACQQLKDFMRHDFDKWCDSHSYKDIHDKIKSF